jgi:hypothetical protein
MPIKPLNSEQSNYFTEKEIQDFKDGSINFPYILYKDSSDQPCEVYEVVMISGMADRKGIPGEITIYRQQKGMAHQRLVYKLVE